MRSANDCDLDLMPPRFEEGLADWSRGHGAPEYPTYEAGGDARIAQGDPDFGACLELRKAAGVQRVRYMGEVPVTAGRYLEVAARLKALRGPLPSVRVAAWPGGAHGQGVAGLPQAGPEVPVPAHGVVTEARAVIGPAARPGVGLVWAGRVLYAHVGLDLLGPPGGVVRIESVRVRDVSGNFGADGSDPPGFARLRAGGS